VWGIGEGHGLELMKLPLGSGSPHALRGSRDAKGNLGGIMLTMPQLIVDRVNLHSALPRSHANPKP